MTKDEMKILREIANLKTFIFLQEKVLDLIGNHYGSYKDQGQLLTSSSLVMRTFIAQHIKLQLECDLRVGISKKDSAKGIRDMISSYVDDCIKDYGKSKH